MDYIFRALIENRLNDFNFNKLQTSFHYKNAFDNMQCLFMKMYANLLIEKNYFYITVFVSCKFQNTVL